MAKVLKLGGKGTINTLAVEIEGKTYSIPLAGSMKRKELTALKKAAESGDEGNADDALYQLISKYIPEEILDELTMDEYGEIIEAWSGTSEKISGESMGES